MFLLVIIIFTVSANVKVEKAAEGKIYTAVDSVPHNKVALLLGTNPLNKWGRPNLYFTNRIKTASELYHWKRRVSLTPSGTRDLTPRA